MNKKKRDNISEIRADEVHDNNDGLHFYRVYFIIRTVELRL
jgi:hypothetical protein